MRISIIIPAYNEETRIKKTLEKYCEFFRELKKKKILDFEILVVLNNCHDNTLGIVKEVQKKFKEIIYLDFEKGGKGFAIIEGFRNALERKNDLIGFVDADMATPPESFSDVVRKCKNYSGVIASRGLKESVVKTSRIRKLTNRGFNFCTRMILFLQYQDTQCGAKIFKRDVIQKINNKMEITEWAYDVNLLYLCKKEGFKILEIPTVWEDKANSKINLTKVPLQMFLALIRLRFIYSPFRKFTKVLKPVARYFWRALK